MIEARPRTPIAMVLAAGFGKRMRPLTDHCPKPLLQVAGKPLIEHTLKRLMCAGVKRVVINLSHLGEQIRERLGDGSRWQLDIQYSREEIPLETGGGILRALPLLGEEPFLVINGDIWCDFDVTTWVARPLPPNCPGRLLLVPNPAHNPKGDFGINNGLLSVNATSRLTIAGISWLRPEILRTYPRARACFGLAEVFAHNTNLLQAEAYSGYWCDVGTPQRLYNLQQHLQQIDTRL